jgi:hypothetical protein
MDATEFQRFRPGTNAPPPAANPTIRATSMHNATQANLLAVNMRSVGNALGVPFDSGPNAAPSSSETPLMSSLQDTAGSLEAANSMLQKIMQAVGV